MAHQPRSVASRAPRDTTHRTQGQRRIRTGGLGQHHLRQFAVEIGHRGVAGLRLRLARLLDHQVEGVVESGVQLTGGDKGALAGIAQGEHFVEHGRGGVDIGAHVGQPSFHLFRRHVVHRAADQVGGGLLTGRQERARPKSISLT
ncbi:hypothetical protein [Candidatus Amarolinea dominans]|uniref:hypothetical protein n=1 Tax=Candidatus Amarolinea dominans TaxID=3140696 RepID=UPI0031CCA09B